MAVFRFSLQKVLEHRLRIEDERKNGLARVQGKINKENALVASLRERRRAVLAGDRGAGPTLLSAAETALRRLFFTGVDGRSAAAARRVEGLQEELAAARRAYAEARKDRQALEKLKEKHKKDFDLQERRAETRRLSELAEQRYARGMGIDA